MYVTLPHVYTYYIIYKKLHSEMKYDIWIINLTIMLSTNTKTFLFPISRVSSIPPCLINLSSLHIIFLDTVHGILLSKKHTTESTSASMNQSTNRLCQYMPQWTESTFKMSIEAVISTSTSRKSTSISIVSVWVSERHGIHQEEHAQ